MKNIIFAVSMMLAYAASAQRIYEEIDSLKRVLSNATEDTVRIAILNALGERLMDNNPDTAIVLGKQALALSKQVDDQKHLATTLAFLGAYFDSKGESDSALHYYALSLPLRQELDDQKGIASIYNNMGIVYRMRSDFDLAIEYTLKALAIHEKRNDLAMMASCYNNIGNVYTGIAEYPKALENYFKALEIQSELGNKPQQAGAYSNIGVVYKRMKNLDKALEYYNKALLLDTELKDDSGIASDYNNIGALYNQLNDYGKALDAYHRALSIKKRISNQMALSVSYNNLGNLYAFTWEDGPKAQATVGEWAVKNPSMLLDSSIYYRELAYHINKASGMKEGMSLNLIGMAAAYVEKKMYGKAIELNTEALGYGKETGARSIEYNAYHGLAIAYQEWANNTANEKIKSAYLLKSLTYIERHMEVKDSVFTEEKQVEIGRLEAEHEYEIAEFQKKQLELDNARVAAAALSRRNTLQYSSILLGLCVLFGGVYFIGKLKLPKWAVELSVFVPFLIFFEFLLVLFDPYGELLTGGAPGYKLLINALLAGLIFPIHSFFESLLKKRFFKKTAESV